MNIIRITFMPKNELRLPYAHFRILQGFFYRLLSFDERVSGETHNKKDGAADAIKLFSFSDIIGKYVNDGKRLIYRDRFVFEIRSVDTCIINTLKSHVESQKEYVINGCDCVAESFSVQEAPELPAGCVYRMNTPITVYKTQDGFRKHYSPHDAEFCQLIETNLRRKYARVYGDDYGGEFCLSCVNPDGCRKCVTKFKEEYVTAYYGDFVLVADEKMQRIAYLCGLGGKNSQGFGFPYMK